MIVRKFMRLLLVPGMAVPLVLVACSSDDSHSLMDTALVDPGLSTKGIDAKIEAAADTLFNGNERSELSFDGESFEFEINEAGKKSSASVEMADAKKFEHTLMAGAREFIGYDITKVLTGGEHNEATLHAVVLARTEPAGTDAKTNDDIPASHLAFGLWMVENEDEVISVGAFGPRGLKGTSVERVAYSERDKSNIKMAEFSGPSIGVKTDGDSSTIFDAEVSLTAKLDVNDPNNHGYSLEGRVHDFNGIDMPADIILKTVPVAGESHISGTTYLHGDTTEMEKGKWQARFASPISIVGSYGFSDDKTHLIGSFGAYQDPIDTDSM